MVIAKIFEEFLTKKGMVLKNKIMVGNPGL